MMQQASNRQANKTRPARSSAAEGKKLWIMMGIIHKSCCHISLSESQGMNTHTHAHTPPLPPLPMNPQWTHFGYQYYGTRVAYFQ